MFTAQQYVKAATLEEAYELNQKRNNAILGGGCWMKMNRRRYQTLIDLSGLGLDKIEKTPDEFVLGAMVTLRQLETSPELKEAFEKETSESSEVIGKYLRQLESEPTCSTE